MNDGLEILSDTSNVELDPEELIDREGWGTSRKDYYDADIIETEADALEEEEEALRLQKKQLQGMTGADFGFDESEWLDSRKVAKEDDNDEQRVVQEVLPQLEISDAMPVEEKSKILAARYPEFEPLSREFLALQIEYEQARLESEAAGKVLDSRQSKTEPGESRMPGAVLRWTALSTYLSALSMYFAILTSGPLDADGKHTSKTPTEMRSHPIMDSLMRSRTTWNKVKDLKLPDAPQDNVIEAQRNGISDRISAPMEKTELTKRLNGESKAKNPRKSKAQIQAEAALAATEARRAERLRRTEASLAQLTKKIASHKSNPQTSSSHQNHEADDSDFDETPVPTEQDAIRRKKSLQFYASQIAQKANKRGTASRDAGGDTDIPYRERLQDRQKRLDAQSEARDRKKADVNGDSSGGKADARAVVEMKRDVNAQGEAEDEEDYYQTIASRTAAKKADKAARLEAQREAAIRGATVRVVEEPGAADGKRAITYMIEKNKGLTGSKRPKSNNPRVKKRKKYETKLKKLGSVRQVFRGGEGKGYRGETTGIKKGVVRSVKL